MQRARWVLGLLLGCAPALGCAPSHSREFSVARAEAEREYTHGRYESAAQKWTLASQAAEAPKDKSEALYRRAQAYRRAEQPSAARASLSELVTRYPKSSRAPRAAYDLGLIEIEQGNVEQGEARLHRMLSDYPDSALATRAFEHLLHRIAEREGPDGASGFVKLAISKAENRELVEKLRYVHANLLREQGALAAALREYLDLAREFPYPEGAYWDDALWHAADIERGRGALERSLSLLRQILREAELAHLQGSYTRARYAQAQYRVAEIYRDDLAEPARARLEFRRVFEQYPTSLLRDDALWQEAMLAKRWNDPAGACEPLALLLKNLPDSRYAACVPLLCPREARPANPPCRGYIQRELEQAGLKPNPRFKGDPEVPAPVQSSK